MEAADLAPEEPEPDILQPQHNPEQVVHMMFYGGSSLFFLERSLNLVANQFLIFFKVLRSPLLPCVKRRSCHEIMLKKKVSELASSLTFASLIHC